MCHPTSYTLINKKQCVLIHIVKIFPLFLFFIGLSFAPASENLLVYFLDGSNNRNNLANPGPISVSAVSGGDLETNFSGVTFPQVPEGPVRPDGNYYWVHFNTSNTDVGFTNTSSFTMTAPEGSYMNLDGSTLSFSWGGVRKGGSEPSTNYSYALYYQAQEGATLTDWTQFNTGNAVVGSGFDPNADFVPYERVIADLTGITTGKNYTFVSLGVAFFSPEGKGERKMAVSNIKITQTQIPEPGTSLLGILGMIGALTYRRKKS